MAKNESEKIKTAKPKTAKPKKNKKGKTPNLSSGKKTAEKMDFIVWCGLPTALKGKIDTQEKFAEAYGVNTATLSKWKREKTFWEEVKKERNNFWKTKAGEALGYLFEKRIKKRGNENAVKIFLQAIGEFEEKKVIETPDNPMTPEKKKQIKEAVEKWKQ